MNNIFKKALSIFLSILLLLSYIPMDILASEIIPSDNTIRTRFFGRGALPTAFEVVQNTIDNNDDPNILPTVALFAELNDENPISTGQRFKYTISYKLDNGPHYQHITNNQSLPTYTKYKSVQIKIKANANIALYNEDGETLGGNGMPYVIDLNDVAAGTTYELFVYARAISNGLTANNTSFGKLDLEMTVKVDVKDENLNETREMVFTNTDIPKDNKSEVIASASTLWGIRKEVASTAFTFEDDATQGKLIKFNYKIHLGRIINGAISNQEGEYKKPGYLDFEPTSNIVLKDLLPSLAQSATNQVNLKPLRASIQRISNDPSNPATIYSYNENTTSQSEFVLTNDINKIDVSDSEYFIALNTIPYYTQYDVEVVYKHKEFELKYGDPRINDTQYFKLDNSASFTYKLVGESEKTINANAVSTYQQALKPAKIKIIPKIKVDGIDKEYNTFLQSVFPNAEYKVFNQNDWDIVNNVPKANANPVQTLVFRSSGISFVQTQDIPAAKYYVQQSVAPSQTEIVGNSYAEIILNDGEVGELIFVNKLTNRGVLIIRKQNAKGDMLKDVGFTLYNGTVATEYTGLTNSSGELILFASPGTYTLVETAVPDGYIKAPSQQITLEDGKINKTLYDTPITNILNKAQLSIKKYAVDYIGLNHTPSNNKALIHDINDEDTNVTDFTFKLERKIDTNEYEVVEAEITLNSLSSYTNTNLQRTNANGEYYTYKLSENDSTNSKYIKDSFVYEWKFDNEINKVAEFYNILVGSMKIKKQYQYLNNTLTLITEYKVGAKFDLYKKVGTDYELVKSDLQSGADGVVFIDKLPIKDNLGNTILYYFVEHSDSANGYTIKVNDENINVSNIDGKVYIGPYTLGFNTVTDYSLSENHYIKNLQNKAGLSIDKKAQDTNTLLSGCKFKIFYMEGTNKVYLSDEQNNPIEYETTDANKTIKLYNLDLKTYYIEETKAPLNYQLNAIPITVALTTPNEIKQASIINTPMPTVYGSKMLVAYNNGSSALYSALTGANAVANVNDFATIKYELWYKQENGTMAQAISVIDGKPIVLNLNANASINRAYIPDLNREYYIKEVGSSLNAIMPSSQNGLKVGAFGIDQNPVQDLVQINSEWYGGPISFTGGNFHTFKWINAQNIAQLTLQKVDKETNAAVKGETQYEIKVNTSDTQLITLLTTKYNFVVDTTNVYKCIVKTPVTTNVVSMLLPIADTTGTSIEYSVKEIVAVDGYMLPEVNTAQTVSFKATLGEAKKTLDFKNVKKAKFKMTKYGYSAFDEGGILWQLGGAKFAIYKVDDNNNLVFIDEKQNNNFGEVEFDNLYGDRKYVVIETQTPQYYRIPGIKKVLNPANALDGMAYSTSLNQYLYREYNFANDLENKTYSVPFEKTMTNEKPYFQLKMKKIGPNGELLNRAKFTLHYANKSDYTGGTTFNQLEAQGKIKEFTPGMIYETGRIEQGIDITRPLDFDKVYWFKEIEPPSGYLPIEVEIGPYTPDINEEANKVTDYEIKNEPDPDYSPGSPKQMFQMEVFKQLYKEDNTYSPMRNVTFAVYIADENFNYNENTDLITKFVTGLDKSQQSLIGKGLSNSVIVDNEFFPNKTILNPDGTYTFNIVLIEESFVGWCTPRQEGIYTYTYTTLPYLKDTSHINRYFVNNPVINDEGVFTNIRIIKHGNKVNEDPETLFVNLPEAEIGIYTDANCTNLYQSFKTNRYGRYTIGLWPKTDYWYKEIKAPNGYEINKNAYPFQTGVFGSQLREYVLNNVAMRELKVVKKDADDKLLNNVLFTVKNSDGTQILDGNNILNDNNTLLANSNQSVLLKGEGTYILEETSINNLATSDIEKHYFKLANTLSGNWNIAFATNEASKTITMVNPGKAQLNIIKTDEENNPIPDVEFKIYFKPFGDNINIEPVGEFGNLYGKTLETSFTVDNNGKYTFNNLMPGWYKLVETIPQGFYGDTTTIIPVFAKYLGSQTGINDVQIKNTSLAYLKISKTFYPSANDIVPAKLRYNLYKDELATISADPAYIELDINNNTGTKTTELKFGTYYVKEQSVENFRSYISANSSPSIPQSAPFKIEINKQHGIASPYNLVYVNKSRYTKLNILKTDDQLPSTSLQGAEFKLYYLDVALNKNYYQPNKTWNINDQTAQVYTTNSIGTIATEILLPNILVTKFYLEEVKAPKGFVESEVLNAQVNAGFELQDNSTKSITIINERGLTITIKKHGMLREHVSATNEYLLANCEFTLYEVNELNEISLVKRATSDANGIATFDNLKKLRTGNVYAISESQRPQGYMDVLNLYNGSNQISKEVIQGLDLYKVATISDVNLDAYNQPYGKIAILKYDYINRETPPINLLFNITKQNDTDFGTVQKIVEYVQANQASTLADGAYVKNDNYYVGTGANTGINYTVSIIDNLVPGTYTVTEDINHLEYKSKFYYPSSTRENSPWYKTHNVTLSNDGKTEVVVFANLPIPSIPNPIISKNVVAINNDTTQTQINSIQYGEQVVSYKISGFLTESKHYAFPIEKVKVVDNELSYKGEDGFTVSNVSSIVKKLTIGKAKYVATITAPTPPQNLSILASVYGYKQNNTKELVETVNVGISEQVIDFTMLSTKYKGFEVVYSDSDTDTLLEGFVADPINVDMAFFQEENTDVYPLIEIKNTVGVTVDYVINNNSQSTEISEGIATVIVTDTLEKPKASIIKTLKRLDADNNEFNVGPSEIYKSVGPGDRVKYTITVSNKSDKDLDIIDPTVLDKLANIFTPDLESIVVNTSQANDIVSQTPVKNGEYLYVDLNGSLHKDESITITIVGTVALTALDYSGNKLINNAYLVSRHLLKKNASNPNGTSFVNTAGSIPGVVLAGSIFGQTGNYDALIVNLQTPFANDKNLKLYKLGSTDVTGLDNFKDFGSYSLVSPSGEMRYKIVLVNGGVNPVKNIRIIDKLPILGDSDVGRPASQRGSKWRVTVQSLQSSSNPVIMYSTTAVENGSNYINSILNGATSTGIWTEGINDTALAILADFGELVLNGGQSVSITINCKAISQEEATTNNLYYQQVVNNATVCTDNNPSKILTSSIVKSTLVPAATSLGNRVWIDINGDGIQNGSDIDSPASVSGEPSFSNTQYPNNIGIILREFENSDTSYTTINSSLGENGYFNFDNVVPAELKEEYITNPNAAYDANGNIINTKLAGPLRKTYQLEFSNLPDGFVLSKAYVTGGDNVAKKLAANDSNYNMQSGKALSERFYVEAGSPDLFKDLGLVPVRNLEITKIGSAYGTLITGAEFNIYGPYDSLNNVVISIDKLVASITSQNGKAEFTSTTTKHILSCAYYVVVETKSGPSYYSKDNIVVSGTSVLNADSFIATGDSITNKNYFGLNTNTAENLGDHQLNIEVKNKYNAKGAISLAIKKELLGRNLNANEFTFNLTSPDGDNKHIGFNDITAKNNIEGYAVLGPINFTEADNNKTYKYTIKETAVPAEAGMQADTSEKQIQLTLSDDKQGNITATLSEAFSDSYQNNFVVKTFTNKLLGNLTIAKIVDGNSGQSTKKFKFNISIDGLTGTQSFNTRGIKDTINLVDGKAQIELKHNESLTILGLLNNSDYEVVEVEANQDHYKTTIKQNGQVSIDGKGKITACNADENGNLVEFTNTKNTGSLKLTKLLSGNYPDTEALFPFDIEFTNANSIDGTYPATGKYSSIVISNNKITNLLLKGNENITIEGLPSGTTYLVKETDSKGHTIQNKSDNGTIGTALSEASFTNYRDVGSLKIQKYVQGNVANINDSFTFSIMITDSNNNPITASFECEGQASTINFIDGKASINLKDGQFIKINKLLSGTKYIVEESGLNDYNLVIAESSVNAQGKAQGTITNSEILAKFTNEKIVKGNLIVQKSLANTANGALLPEFINMEYEMKIAFTPYKASFNLGEFTYNANGTYNTVKTDVNNVASNGTLVIENNETTIKLKAGEKLLITGLYTGLAVNINEKSYLNLGFSTSYEKASDIISTADLLYKVINDRQVGDLTIDKLLEGNAGDKNKAFNFTLRLIKPITSVWANDYNLPTTLDVILVNVDNTESNFALNLVDGVYKFALKDKQKIKVQNILAGLQYIVDEASYSSEGYATTATNASDIIIYNSNTNANFINTKNQGTLVVTNTVKGNAGDNNKEFDYVATIAMPSGITAPTSYKAVFSKADASMEEIILPYVDNKVSFKLKHNESIEIKDIIVGAIYDVSQTSYEAEGYKTTKTIAIGDGAMTSTGAKIDFENERNSGALNISNKLEGNGIFKDDIFKYIISLNDPDGNPSNKEFKFTSQGIATGKIKFVNGIASIELLHNQSINILDILYGSEYKVEQLTPDRYGYITEPSNMIYSGTINQPQYLAPYVNTRNVGELSIQKLVSGYKSEKDRGFVFHISLINPDGIPNTCDVYYRGINIQDGKLKFNELGEASIKLKHDQSIIIFDVLVGTKFKISEEATSSYLTKVFGNENGIMDIIGNSLVYTNIKTQYAGLTIAKAVTGNAANITDKFEFTITLTNPDKTEYIGDVNCDINGIKQAIKTKNGKIKIMISHGQTAILSDILTGTNFKVVESYAGKYATFYQNNTGVIENKDVSYYVVALNRLQVPEVQKPNKYIELANYSINFSMNEGDCFN